MENLKLEKLIICLFLFTVVTGRICSPNAYNQDINNSNCTREEFLPLCEEERICRHYTLHTLTAEYFDDVRNKTIVCTIPRIKVGREGFVQCKDFSTHYSCPQNSSLLSLRTGSCRGGLSNSCGNEGLLGSETGFKCLSDHQLCTLPQELLYDNIADCEMGDDLCFTDGSYSKLSDSCHMCPDGTIIPTRAICDGRIDCPDLSDECQCLDPIPICLQQKTFFNVAHDCKIGEISCGDGTCIKSGQMCDGSIDCPLNQLDERSEYCGATLNCKDVIINSTEYCRCPMYNFDTIIDYELYTVTNRTSKCPPKGARLIQNNVTCGITAPPDLKVDKAATGIECNGIVECETTGLDEKKCSSFYRCKGFVTEWLSIPIQKVCDFQKDCADASDEMNCERRFYCEADNTSFIRLHQVRNGRSDCDDGSDECQDDGNTTNSYFFHSQRQLIRNQVLYFLVWVMGLLALIGNMMVIVWQIKILLKLRRRTNDLSSLRANHILVLNLALSDFLMGVYLLAVGIAYESLKDSYCQAELLWRGSSICTWMGVTAFISSQTSVLTMIMLTTCRLYALLQPFKTSIKPKSWLVILLAMGAWIVSAIAATIPLTDVFRASSPDKVLLEDNPFLNSVEDLNAGKKFLLQELLYYPPQDSTNLTILANQIRNAPTWNALLSFYDQQPLQIAARYGYYNVHSICIADFFPRSTDTYVALSLSVIIFNFVAFLYIATVYFAIYYISFKKKQAAGDRSDAVTVQRKIFRIIFTNFLTWIPVCILSFLRLSDTEATMIDGEVYQVAAIVLLPINSAINPVLYSNAFSFLFRKVCGYADDFKRRTIRLASVDTTLSNGKSTMDRQR